jgi:hypothetical protein
MQVIRFRPTVFHIFASLTATVFPAEKSARIHASGKSEIPSALFGISCKTDYYPPFY